MTKFFGGCYATNLVIFSWQYYDVHLTFASGEGFKAIL